jgi:uncharacterized delta-60 repeat protein
VAGANSVIATSTGLSGSPVTFSATGLAGALASIAVTPNPLTIGPGGTQQFTAAGKDGYNNAVSIAPVWSVTGGIGTVNSSGLFTAVTVGSGAVVAASGSISGSASVTVALVPSQTNSTVVASPTSVNANGVHVSTVTVTLKDASNNSIVGHGVTISSGAHPTTIAPSSATTNSSGQAAFTVKSTQEGVATITATDTTVSVALSNTATITFNDVTPPNEATNLAATPKNARAELSWTASTSGDVAGYKVYTRVSSGSYDAGVSVGNVVAYQKTGLTNGTSYYFKVTAYDEVPNESVGVEVGPITVQPLWDKKINSSSGSNSDYAYSVAIDSADGSVYVVGRSDNLVSGTSGYDWWIKKFSSSGVEDTANWNKMFNSSGTNNDVAYSVAIAPDGSVYVVGYGTDLVGSSGRDWWIKKFSSSGVEDTANWDKKFDSGSSPNDDEARSVAIASDGSVYVVGYGTKLGGLYSGADWWIKKFSSSGVEDTANWNKKIDSAGWNDVAYSVAIDPADGSVYVVGYGTHTDPLVSGSPGVDWWLKKFNSSGVENTTNWDKKTYRTNGDEAFSVAIYPNDGSVYVVGYVGRGAFEWEDWWIKKFSFSGVEDTANWDKMFGYSTGTNDYARSVAVASDGSVYVVGTPWIKKFNSSGVEDTTNWNKQISGFTAYSVAVASDGSVYVVGWGTHLVTGSSYGDWWIKKFTSGGVEE